MAGDLSVLILVHMHAGMGQACWDIAYCPIQYTYSHCTSPPFLIFGCLPAVMPHAYLAFELSYAPGACRGGHCMGQRVLILI